MGYIPKFIHFDHFIRVDYPFGVNWEHDYIQQSAEVIYNTYKEDIEEDVSITFIVRGTSGAMIAGAVANELHHIISSIKTCILIVRKSEDYNAHCSSLYGIDRIGAARIVVIDDFITSGDTIEAILQSLDKYFGVISHPTKKYDMLCVSNFIDTKALKKNSCDDYKKWKGICSRFNYVVCCPRPTDSELSDNG